MNETPDVTRIVTCYGQWHYFADWVFDDALFPAWVRWIILNDRPGDACPPDIAARLETVGARVESSEFNLGRSAQRNLGARLADTPWVEFVDGDDLPLPLDREDFAQQPEAVDVLHFRHQIHQLSGNDPRERNLVEAPQLPDDAADDDLLAYGASEAIRPANLAFRRRSFLAVGGYDARFEGAEDTHLLWKLMCRRAGIAQVARPKQSYNDHHAGKPEMMSVFWTRVKFADFLASQDRLRLNPERIAENDGFRLRSAASLLLMVSHHVHTIVENAPALAPQQRESIRQAFFYVVGILRRCATRWWLLRNARLVLGGKWGER